MSTLVCRLVLSELYLCVAFLPLSLFSCPVQQDERLYVTVVSLAELFMPSSGRHGIPVAGKSQVRGFLIGSFHVDLTAVTGQSSYRIIATTDDGSFSVLFQSI